MGTDLRNAARQALVALEELNGWQSLAPPLASEAAKQAAINLRAALEQQERPNFTLSCGCPSQYGGVPAYWDRDGSTAFGMVCERHWHEYDARAQA